MRGLTLKYLNASGSLYLDWTGLGNIFVSVGVWTKVGRAETKLQLTVPLGYSECIF
jgi:hypothetical protein